MGKHKNILHIEQINYPHRMYVTHGFDKIFMIRVYRNISEIFPGVLSPSRESRAMNAAENMEQKVWAAVD